MTPERFLALAVELPEAVQGEHMGHPDVRVRRRIFATVGPDGTWAGLKLTPAQQAACTAREPEVYAPFPGGWGKGGFTRVTLAAARVADVRRMLVLAWANAAPRSLAARHLED